jgi:superfamily II DNA or RNA helicase
MSRVSFKTGKAHQEAAAVWARRRLADQDGRRFSLPDDQDGVLFADSVGMGKTWEALAAAALLLYKQRPERGRRHVLILCPANLITKWEDELAAGSRFRQALDRWRAGIRAELGRRYADRVVDTLTHVLPIRRGGHVSTRLKHGRFRPPAGTYIISHGLVTRSGRGLAALGRESWDVVIVDEAHHASARKAIEAVEPNRGTPTKLLLSATPFQLEPRQWNELAKHLIKGRQLVFSRPEIRTYIDKVDAVFRNPSESGPSAAEVEMASTTLGKIAVRSIPSRSRRCYSIIRLDGSEYPLSSSLDELHDSAVSSILTDLGASPRPHRTDEFAQMYFRRRLELAEGEQRTYVATTLRRLLSKGSSSIASPRLTALSHWARIQFAEDIEAALRSGQPHKTIVFTSWVGEPMNGEAAVLRGVLTEAFSGALSAVKRKHPRWRDWKAAGLRRLESLPSSAEVDLQAVIRGLALDELTLVLAGAHRGFLKRLRDATGRQLKAVRATELALAEVDDRRSIESRALQRRLNDMRAALNPWGGSRPIEPVARYTGGDERLVRDRAATAFRQIGPPWVLVSSQVGSEGIDLQTYTHRVVHYDLEWNPARMEQREGRGDRVGRLLSTDLRVAYCLVPRTYDERMFHQLVARDRWHGVLLGKPAKALDTDIVDAPLLDRSRLRKMRLKLSPDR